MIAFLFSIPPFNLLQCLIYPYRAAGSWLQRWVWEPCRHRPHSLGHTRRTQLC